MNLAVLLMMVAWTQAPAAPAPGSRLEGVVTGTDGTPLAAARIVLRKDQSVRSESDYGTMTTSDGHFVLRNIAAGRYRLLVRHTGYVDAEYGQKRPNRPGSILDLSRAQALTDVVVQMTPGSIISGRVFEQNGQPLENVQMQLTQTRYQSDGKVIPLMITTATTNDLGEYRLYGVAPGNYYLVAILFNRSPQTDTALDEQFEGVESSVSPTFYPNSLDDEHATPLKIEAGSELRGIDVTMTRLRTVHVRGQVIDGTSGQAVPGARVSVRLKQGGWANLGPTISGITGMAGEFDLRRVAPGTNTVSATMTFSGGRQETNYTDVQVGDRDISDLRLVLQSPPSVSGRIIFENGASRNGALSFSEINGPAGFGTVVLPDGTFNMTSIAPGRFRLSLNGLPENFLFARRTADRATSCGMASIRRPGRSTVWKFAWQPPPGLFKEASSTIIPIPAPGYRLF